MASPFRCCTSSEDDVVEPAGSPAREGAVPPDPPPPDNDPATWYCCPRISRKRPRHDHEAGPSTSRPRGNEAGPSGAEPSRAGQSPSRGPARPVSPPQWLMQPQSPDVPIQRHAVSPPASLPSGLQMSVGQSPSSLLRGANYGQGAHGNASRSQNPASQSIASSQNILGQAGDDAPPIALANPASSNESRNTSHEGQRPVRGALRPGARPHNPGSPSVGSARTPESSSSEADESSERYHQESSEIQTSASQNRNATRSQNPASQSIASSQNILGQAGDDAPPIALANPAPSNESRNTSHEGQRPVRGALRPGARPHNPGSPSVGSARTPESSSSEADESSERYHQESSGIQTSASQSTSSSRSILEPGDDVPPLGLANPALSNESRNVGEVPRPIRGGLRPRARPHNPGSPSVGSARTPEPSGSESDEDSQEE